MPRILVRWNWEPVGPIQIAEDAQTLRWPTMPSGSGAYRITLHLAGRTRTYVGETDGYKRRFHHYARPGPTQTTNIRMNARLVTLLAIHGGTAHIDVAISDQLEIDGAAVNAASLPEVFVRRLIENAALCDVAGGDGEIVNGRGFPEGELWPA